MENKTLSKTFNTKNSLLQAFYWMSFCVVIPYAAVFLQSRGYSNSELGLIMAVGNIAALLLQPPVAGIADRSRRLSLPIIMLMVLAVLALSYAVNLLVSGRNIFVWLAYAMYVCCIFLMQPLCNSVSGLMERRGARINFGVARGIGSLAFAVLAVILGAMVDSRGAEVLAPAGLILSAGMALVLWDLSRHFRPGSNAKEQQAKASSRGLLEFFRSDRRFMRLLLGIAFMYFSHAVITNFLINIVDNLGGGSAEMGVLNAYTAMVELPAMWGFAWLLRRWRCSSLFRLSIVMFAVKAFAVWVAPNMATLYVAQALQMLSFAIYIPASVRYVEETVAPADQVKGQAFVTSVVTLSSVFASLLGGVMFDHLGVSTTVLISGIVSAVGAVIAVPAVRKTETVK